MLELWETPVPAADTKSNGGPDSDFVAHSHRNEQLLVGQVWVTLTLGRQGCHNGRCDVNNAASVGVIEVQYMGERAVQHGRILCGKTFVRSYDRSLPRRCHSHCLDAFQKDRTGFADHGAKRGDSDVIK